MRRGRREGERKKQKRTYDSLLSQNEGRNGMSGFLFSIVFLYPFTSVFIFVSVAYQYYTCIAVIPPDIHMLLSSSKLNAPSVRA